MGSDGHKILFTNIGYAKDINGSLQQHVRRLSRHFYTNPMVQQKVLGQLKHIIARETPDLCCLVEVDEGSFHSARFNQIQALVDDIYKYHDIAGKYGENSWLSRMFMHKGKSNAFLASKDYPFEKLYFENGTKRLIYRVELTKGIYVLFAHFSLQKNVRLRQFQELKRIIRETEGEVVILGDFNIMQGFIELEPLLADSDLQLLNREGEFTFTFSRRRLTLDLCLCSRALAPRAHLRVIDQPFSDHDALLLHLADA